jgi:hypothetical protein
VGVRHRRFEAALLVQLLALFGAHGDRERSLRGDPEEGGDGHIVLEHVTAGEDLHVDRRQLLESAVVAGALLGDRIRQWLTPKAA